MIGTDKGFEAEKTLTRAETAAILVRAKGVTEDQVKSAAGATQFLDVPESHWATGYINLASSMQLIKGTGDGNFLPDKDVTYEELLAMLTRILGA